MKGTLLFILSLQYHKFNRVHEMKNEYELNVAPFKYYHPKCKITLGGDDMKNEKSERKFDFRPMGLAIKKAREKKGMTQEQLAYIVDRAPRTIMYNENDGQHPSFNTFYQMVTMFDISVDQYFYPSQNSGSECRKRIDAMLNALDERELKIVEATIQAMKASKETEET